MGKTGDAGRSLTSELKVKQWFRWASGDGPLPDRRSRKIMAGTAGLFFVLVALGLLMIGGGGSGAPRTPATTTVPSAPYSSPSLSQDPSQQATGVAPVASTPVTPTTAPTGLAAAGTGVAKRTHAHARHAGGRRAHTRASGSHA